MQHHDGVTVEVLRSVADRRDGRYHLAAERPSTVEPQLQHASAGSRAEVRGHLPARHHCTSAVSIVEPGPIVISTP